MQFTREFSLFFMLVLSLELAAPLAFAEPQGYGYETPSAFLTPPTYNRIDFASPFDAPGICEVNEMTPDQVQFFWQQTQGFRAEELNSLSGGQLLANRPSQNINININVNKPEGVFPFSTIARFLALNEDQSKEGAKFLGKEQTDRITEEEAKQIARKYNKDVSGLSDFLSSLRGTPSEEAPSFENYKLKLINGAEIPVKSLRNNIEQTKACVINSAHIVGKVSYVSSLSDDLAVSFDRSPTNIKKTNRLWSRETNADLDLQGASTLVIPKHYEELVKKLKFWIMTDILLTAAQMTVYFGGVKYLEKYQKKLQEIEERAVKFQPNDIIFRDIQSSPLKLEVYSLGSRATVTKAELSKAADRMEDVILAEFQQARGPFPAGTTTSQAITQVKADPVFAGRYAPIDEMKGELGLPANAGLASTDSVDDIYRKYESRLKATAELNERELQEVEKAKIRSRSQQEYGKTLKELEGQEYETDLQKVKNRLKVRTGDFWFRVMLGMAWLGPGRFVFELTDAVNFRQISSKAFSDNYIVIFADKDDLVGEFRRATNWVLSGTVTDALSDLTEGGIPTAAYRVGNLLFVNQPVEGGTAPTPSSSVTSFVAGNGDWSVSTAWQGKSDALVAEELDQRSEYARLPLEVKGKTWNLKIRAKKEFEAFYDTMKYVVPLLSWRILGAQDYAVTGVRLLAYDFYVTDVVNPGAFKKDEECTMEKIDDYVGKYRALTIANQVVGALPLITPWFTGVASFTKTTANIVSKTSVIGKRFTDKYVSAVVQVLDPITLAQGYYAAQALEYASSCRDSQYTILTWNSLKKKTGSTLSDKLKGISTNDVVSKLNIGKAAFGIGQEVDTASLSEYANLKAELNDQHSSVKADKLYYLNFKDASIQWLPSLASDQPAACQNKCLDSDNTAACLDPEKGVEVCDKSTGICTKVANKERAANHLEADPYAATIIPNKYVSTTLAGCPGNAFQIDASKSLQLIASSGCAGAQCMRNQLQYLTGRAIQNDLTGVLGRVTRIYTTGGSADFADAGIRFNAFSPINGEVELRSPGINVLENADSSQELFYKQAALLLVDNNGRTTLHGFINSTNLEDIEVGELRTIMTERGRINYLGNGQVQIFLHVLGQVNAATIKDINTAPVQQNQCVENSNPGIKITRLEGFPGVGDVSAAELNAALEKIQGCNGMQILETPNKKFIFTKDENGNPVLRVIDKNTGQVTDYKITGPLRQEGKDIIVPTDKGDFRFNIGMGENGQPTLSVQGPNGLNEILPLLAARGLGGILMFDPRTGQWSAFNGQDLAMNPNFASKGQTYSADSNGNMRGVPGDSLLFPPTRRRQTGGNTLASLPSWPEDNLGIILLVITALAGVAAVRWRGLFG